MTDLLKQLHQIVNTAILTAGVGNDQAEGLTFDLSTLDLDRLSEEFAKKATRKATAIQDIRELVEKKLAEMLARNPLRMDYQIKYEEIVAAYNEKIGGSIVWGSASKYPVGDIVQQGKKAGHIVSSKKRKRGDAQALELVRFRQVGRE